MIKEEGRYCWELDPKLMLGRVGWRIWKPKGQRPLSHLPVAEPLQAAIPTQDTKDRLPLGRVAPKLGQGPSVLSDSGQLLWEEGPSDVRGTGQCLCPDHPDSSHCVSGTTKNRALGHCYVAFLSFIEHTHML